MSRLLSKWRLVTAAAGILVVTLIGGLVAPAASAAATATISGTITAPAGANLSHFYVYAQPENGSNTYGAINADGTYSISGLTASNYSVSVYGPSEFLEERKAVTLSSGQAFSGLDFNIKRAAFIEGKVTVPNGVNTTEILASAYDAAEGPDAQPTTATFLNASGEYRIWGLPAGSYKIRFSHNASGNGGTLITQWFANQLTFDSAQAVQVSAGQTLTGVNVTMVTGATIKGRVNGPSAAVMPYVCIGAFPADDATAVASRHVDPERAEPLAAVGSPCPFSWFSSASSFAYPAADGTYTIAALPAGNYNVVALPVKYWDGTASKPASFAAQWYSGKLLRSSAVVTTLTVPQNVTGVDFTLRPFTSFSDVPSGAQFFDDITWLGTTGISTGYPNGDGTSNYVPLNSVNRDAMAAFMYRLAGSPAFTAPAVSPFADITPSTQFYKEITWLAAQGISTGWTEANGTKTYRPLQAVNRDAMAAFLYRFADSPTFTPPTVTPFADVATDNQFYKQITWLASTGITTGWTQPDGTKTFQPVSAVARDAMAAFMHRYQILDSPQLKIAD